MELVGFAMAVGLIAWLIFRQPNRRGRSEAISPELAQRQLQYMQVMNISPRLQGDGSYAVRVIGGAKFETHLQTIREMLLQQYTTDSTFMAVLQVEESTSGAQPGVQILVGDEHVGHLPGSLAKAARPILEALGGRALAEARLSDPDSPGHFHLELDLVVPLKITT